MVSSFSVETNSLGSYKWWKTYELRYIPSVWKIHKWDTKALCNLFSFILTSPLLCILLFFQHGIRVGSVLAMEMSSMSTMRHLKNHQFCPCFLSPPNLIQIGQQEFSSLEKTYIDNIKRTQLIVFLYDSRVFPSKFLSQDRWWNQTSYKPWVSRLGTTRSIHHVLDSCVHIYALLTCMVNYDTSS